MRWQLLDRIVDCQPQKSALGIKCFSRSELFFEDHFPGHPIVPGVLQIEMMAQMAGKCISLGYPDLLPVLAVVKNTKFIRSIVPGDQCWIYAEITKVSRQYSIANARIEVDKKKVSTSELMFGFILREQLKSNSFDAVTEEWVKRTNFQRELSHYEQNNME